MPAAAELVRLVHAGAVGRPRMVAMREHRFPFLDKVGNWNRFSANTGGTLVEKTCHFFDLMNLILRRAPGARDGLGRPGRQPPRRGATTGGRPRHARQRLRHRRLPERGPGDARPVHVRRGDAPPGGDCRVVGVAGQGRGADPVATPSASAGGASTGSAASSRTGSSDPAGRPRGSAPRLELPRARPLPRRRSARAARPRSRSTTASGPSPWASPPTAASSSAARSTCPSSCRRHEPAAGRAVTHGDLRMSTEPDSRPPRRRDGVVQRAVRRRLRVPRHARPAGWPARSSTAATSCSPPIATASTTCCCRRATRSASTTRRSARRWRR